MAPYGTNWILRWYSRGKAKSEAEGAALMAGTKRSATATSNAAGPIEKDIAAAAPITDERADPATTATEPLVEQSASKMMDTPSDTADTTTVEASHNAENGAVESAKAYRPKVHHHESVDKIRNAFKFKHQHAKEV